MPSVKETLEMCRARVEFQKYIFTCDTCKSKFNTLIHGDIDESLRVLREAGWFWNGWITVCRRCQSVDTFISALLEGESDASRITNGKEQT